MSKFQLTGRKRQAAGIILIAIMLWVIIYAPTSLVIYEPGLTFETEPLVQHGQGEKRAPIPSEEGEQGAFLLTTVKLTDAKYWQVIQAAWKKDFAVYSKDSVMQGMPEKEYQQAMKLEMTASKHFAVEAAYRYAGIAYTTSTELYISKIYGESKDIRVGDRVIKVEGENVNDMEQFTAAVMDKKEGDIVALVLQRGENKIFAMVPYHLLFGNITNALIAPVPDGLSLGELDIVVPENPADEIEIKAGDIGGPSAGLMFTLQSLNLLLEKDMTEGLRIAGTGTMDSLGNVGAIGGIAYKVAAADQAGAQLFLAPEGNYAEASAKAKELHSEMKVVPVTSLDTAVSAIRNAAAHINE
ncbi:PDZ domain-containing protein [Paenibacillus catalpae]|uniref:PDZ domain-containing protein n=1 Tax=Paenibacillus catalpae TaxID=1045775 RepID=A0A1I1UEW6_9BACL|nr:S16 family serine protease [Paenibacillus catalpae]SFD67313.1 PDZ domain-containing protein [Paenibacillus catalpae]